MTKIKTTLLSTILFVLGTMLVCFGVFAMPAKQTYAQQNQKAETTTEQVEGGNELNAGEGVAYLNSKWQYYIKINGGSTGDLSAVTSITFNYQTDLSGITGYNVGAKSVTDTSYEGNNTIIASVNGTDITIYSSQPTVAFPEDSHYLFSNNNSAYCLESLTTLSWGNVTIDTSSVTDMSLMFYNCTSLTNLDVSNFDTGSVTYMYSMFAKCSSLRTLDVSNFDTSNVTQMYRMFSSCTNLTTLDVSNWDTSSVTDMNGMFCDCKSLTGLDMSNWDTSSVKSMYEILRGCTNLTTLDVNNWDTSSVTDMRFTFYDCKSLTSLDISKWNTSSVTEMGWMFGYCVSLSNLDVSNFKTGNVTNMQAMFCCCFNLPTIDVSKWDTGKVTDMDAMFENVRTASGKFSSQAIAITLVGAGGPELDYMANDFYSNCIRYFGINPNFTGDDDDAEPIIEQLLGEEVEKGPIEPMKIKSLNLGNWVISSTTTTQGISFNVGGNRLNIGHMFLGCDNLVTVIAPQTCNTTIALPVTLYDLDGNEYTSLSEATNGSKMLIVSPPAGFDGAELVATTSVGLVALLAVCYCLIANKKRKENKYNI